MLRHRLWVLLWFIPVLLIALAMGIVYGTSQSLVNFWDAFVDIWHDEKMGVFK